jgi:nucleoside-diphosphate-sugar epimerase
MRAFVTGGSGFIGRHLIQMLVRAGWTVRALERADGVVGGLGAEPIRGDLDATAALREGMEGCDVAFHLAAMMSHAQGRDALFRVNVGGTRAALEAARAARVRRFVFASTSAILVGGRRLVDADETWPVPERPVGLYPWTKAVAEREVLAATGEALETVAVRPCLVWGPGDTSTLPQLVAAARARRFSWIDGGRFPISTCHARNACEGLLCAAERGRGGQAYFVTDGAPVELRSFFTRLMQAQGVDPGARSAPRALVMGMARLIELPWRLLPLRSAPPEHLRQVVESMGQQTTVSDARARREIGYAGRVSVEEGLAELAATAG